MGTFLTLLILVLLGLAIWAVIIYNRLQSSMQNIREGYSNLQAGLKKRHQLSAQIIEIASGYLEHEQVVQLEVARQQQNMQQLMFLSQSYPELKADATYRQLMQKLEALENDILARRESYNQRVKTYNSYRNTFPNVLIAQKLSFNIVNYFEADDEKFDMEAAGFSRDDSVALQEIIGSSARALSEAASKGARAAGDVAGKAADNISRTVSQLRQDMQDHKPQTPPPTDQPPTPTDENNPRSNT